MSPSERLQLLLRVQEAEVAVEIAAYRRDPVDAPSHPLLVSAELLERRPRGQQHGDVPRRQVGQVRVDIVRNNDAFAALAHPIRREIVERLSGGARTVGEAGRGLGVTKPTISRHLKMLEDAGVVTRVIDGRTHRLSLEPEALADAAESIESQRERWERLFDVVGDYLEERKERG